MKFFLIGFAGLSAVLMAVLVIGYLLPQRHVVSRSALYKATPVELFSLISGPQEWRPDVKKFEVLQISPANSQVRETTSNGETITYEILQSDAPTMMVRRIADKNLPYGGTWTYRVNAEVGQSRLSIQEDGEVFNPVFRFVSRYIFGHSKTIDTYLRNVGAALGQTVEIRNELN